MAGWLFAAMLLYQIVDRFFPETAPLVRFSALILMGLANAAAMAMHRPSVFEVSIAAAFAFTSLAWWQLAVSVWRPPGRRALPLAVASLALGLAVAARASWVIVTPVLLVALWDVRHQWRGPLFRSLLGWATAPVLTCLLALLVLNIVRFGDPLEFGQSYQLSGLRPTSDFFSLSHLPFSIYMYLLAPPATSDYFPFLLPSSVPYLPADSRGSENVFGLLPLLPVLAAAFLVPLALRRPGLRNVVAILVCVFSCMLFFLSCIHGVALRYQMDLAPSLALLAAVGLLAGEARWRRETVIPLPLGCHAPGNVCAVCRRGLQPVTRALDDGSVRPQVVGQLGRPRLRVVTGLRHRPFRGGPDAACRDPPGKRGGSGCHRPCPPYQRRLSSAAE